MPESNRDNRPNPDELLNRLQQEEQKAQRGKLKIFFGASAGVGKTYAMLSMAKSLRSQGLEVVVGIVETHGRAETISLLEGLEILPLKAIEYRGKHLLEFDLDAALLRKPVLLLVDELAHSNVPGSRHPKRWQDVEELLAAGIDVYTTVNVQHLESLNDVVSGITGIRVWETLPDKVFNQADEVILVDLTPDELLQRLKEGKVYLPQQAERAIQNFFRKGNLIALRELSLRRTADRVDHQMRDYRRECSIATVWQTKESLLVCVGPAPGDDKIVRGASRLASQLQAEWHAVYVETPPLQRLPAMVRERILGTLRLAKELGAHTATLAGHDSAQSLTEYARNHNLSKLVVGRHHSSHWLRWQGSFANRLGQLAPDLDVIQIASESPDERQQRTNKSPIGLEDLHLLTEQTSSLFYVWAVGACGFTTVLATLLSPYFDRANIVMLFLLTVVLVAIKYGRGPAILAAFTSVACFDFFFVPPYLSFAVSDVQYLLTFAVMLIMALIIGPLTANLRYQARIAARREARSLALYEMARELSATLLPEQLTTISDQFIQVNFLAHSTLLLPDEHNRLRSPDPAANHVSSPPLDLGIAQWSFDHGQAAGFGTDTLPGSPGLYLPLRASMGMRGVLVVHPTKPRWLLIPEQRRQLESFAALMAITLERIHYIEVAQQALISMESEQMRNSILSALSHDLRTPLTTLVELTDSLMLTPPVSSATHQDLAKALHDEALRMTTLVNNLLDMARLQSGHLQLKRQWQPLEEVMGNALKARVQQLAKYQVQVSLPPQLALLEFDAEFIERVLCNLLDNVTKYTPPGTEVQLAAKVEGGQVYILVTDNGPGLPPGREEAIFEKFTRGKQESATPGMGLGLAIGRAIVEAHQGRIWAENVATGGARFVFTLPLGSPPALDDLNEERMN